MDIADFTFFTNLEEAKADPSGAIYFEGDYGGQIYLSALASEINCTEECLRQLLVDIENLPGGWGDLEGSSITFASVAYVPSVILGGMGGGMITNGIWVHGDLSCVENEIKEVLRGQRERL